MNETTNYTYLGDMLSYSRKDNIPIKDKSLYNKLVSSADSYPSLYWGNTPTFTGTVSTPTSVTTTTGTDTSITIDPYFNSSIHINSSLKNTIYEINFNGLKFNGEDMCPDCSSKFTDGTIDLNFCEKHGFLYLMLKH